MEPRPSSPPATVSRAVVLAAGRGRRLRAGAGSAALSEEQREAARQGLKGLVPVAGRPLLDRVLEDLAAAGVGEVCLVTGPGTEAVRERYEARAPARPALSFAFQERALGTADALLAARGWVGEEPFLLVNGDNLYPVEGLRTLAGLPGPGVLALERAGVLASGATNVGEERLASYALLEHSGGRLTGLREKPGVEALRRAAEPVLLGVNAWRFGPAIFPACRAVAPSERGELELPAAVRYALEELGERFEIVVSTGPFWDLTEAADVARLDRRLAAAEASG